MTPRQRIALIAHDHGKRTSAWARQNRTTLESHELGPAFEEPAPDGRPVPDLDPTGVEPAGVDPTGGIRCPFLGGGGLVAA